MQMSWKLEIPQDGCAVVRIEGYITEESDFRELIELATAQPIGLDLTGVELVNSCGVREWIQFMAALAERGRSPELRGCSPAIVRQLNMISNFGGSGRVCSVWLPYYCEHCGADSLRLLELAEGGALPSVVDEIACDACGAGAEFDDFPESYLAFAHAG